MTGSLFPHLRRGYCNFLIWHGLDKSKVPDGSNHIPNFASSCSAIRWAKGMGLLDKSIPNDQIEVREK